MSLNNIVNDIIYVENALGKNGKEISVYKFRTMYPDADSMLERYINQNGIDELGKPINDHRIIPSLKWMRKYFLDELPQLYNIMRGDMKFVGIRPKHNVVWNKYPEEIKNRALRHKPGLFGVQYALMGKKEFEDMIEVENEYLKEKERHPVLTDIKYLSLMMYNIILRGVRSR